MIEYLQQLHCLQKQQNKIEDIVSRRHYGVLGFNRWAQNHDPSPFEWQGKPAFVLKSKVKWIVGSIKSAIQLNRKQKPKIWKMKQAQFNQLVAVAIETKTIFYRYKNEKKKPK